MKALIRPFLPVAVRKSYSSWKEQRRKSEASSTASQQLTALLKQPNSPFSREPRPGFLRGIDYYSRNELSAVLSCCYEMFHLVHGRYPNLLDAQDFNAKCVRSKFLAELPVPESGNKLLTSTFIPPEAASRLRTPRIIWHSAKPELPSNNVIPAGEYYLKASHGSGLYRKIRYPLSPADRSGLEALSRGWLQYKFGLADGEWWYNTFTKEIMIEEQIGTGDHSVTWNVYTFGEQIGFVNSYRKVTPIASEIDESLWLDKDFKPLPFQNPCRRRPAGLAMSQRAQREMIELARIMGRQFKCVRVDFLMDTEERFYLGEMTFCPLNGLNTSRPHHFNMWMGSLWDQSAY